MPQFARDQRYAYLVYLTARVNHYFAATFAPHVLYHAATSAVAEDLYGFPAVANRTIPPNTQVFTLRFFYGHYMVSENSAHEG